MNLGRYILLLMVAVLVFSSFSFMAYASDTPSTPAKDGRLLTIHDRGEDRVILTHTSTLRDAFKEAGISVLDEDIVEPGLDGQLVATDYTVNIYRARPVIVEDGMVRQKVMTAAQTPEAIAKSANLTLHDEDKADVAANTNIIADGAAVVMKIDRATEFTLNLYGTSEKSYSRAASVGEMLDAKDIVLGKDDTISMSRTTPLAAGMTVTVWRNGVQTATVEETIKFPTRQVQDVDQPVGYRKVQTPGTNGRKNVTYQITMQNGKEVKRVAIQSVTLEEPKEQVEAVGAKTGFSGDFVAALARLRSCEGKYTSNTGNGYYGAYQYDIATWGGYKGYANASLAPPAVQDAKVWETYQRRGWQPWPSCSKKMQLQDIYR